MSTVFYIVDKDKRKEHKEFNDFLDRYRKKMIEDLNSYVNNVNGKSINLDNLDYDIENEAKKFIDNLKYSIDLDEIRFGQEGSHGFTFTMDYTCRFLSCFEDVKNYLEENKSLIIVDEYDKEYSLEEFKELVN